MDKPKRPSGGARATVKRQQLREETARRAAAAGIQPPAPPPPPPPPAEPPVDARRAGEWLLERLVGLGIAAEQDGGLTPPQQRREAREHYAAAGKLVDAAKLRVELDELLALLDRRAGDGAQVDGLEAGGGPTPTRQ